MIMPVSLTRTAETSALRPAMSTRRPCRFATSCERHFSTSVIGCTIGLISFLVFVGYCVAL
jgi:hypothetical protein